MSMDVMTRCGILFHEAPKGKNYIYFALCRTKLKIDIVLFRSTSRSAYKIRNVDVVFETLEDVALYITEVFEESTLPQPTIKKSSIFHGIHFVDDEKWFLVGCMPFDLGVESRTLGYFKDKKLAAKYSDILRRNFPLGMDLWG